MIAAPQTRFIGGWELNNLLTEHGLTRADWSALVARGAVPPPTFAWAGAAKWRRTAALAAIRAAAKAAQTRPETHLIETLNHD